MAGDIFEQMQAANCKPDFITFTALVSAYEKGGQWMRALQVRRDCTHPLSVPGPTGPFSTQELCLLVPCPLTASFSAVQTLCKPKLAYVRRKAFG